MYMLTMLHAGQLAAVSRPLVVCSQTVQTNNGKADTYSYWCTTIFIGLTCLTVLLTRTWASRPRTWRQSTVKDRFRSWD